ncbi:L-lactate dehydrogenase complex protein LldE [Rhodoblastus acidophilus]|uniref:L-lactate dehydrogenase complex protein LldE n=1 Tax=Rhodoblastus acidophilus TaxID=1074 RepID=A0A212RCP0_RHOAC|nr:(Fe-S)-binding protein [Rhodoblastus acidophilus]MCW2317156.1 L-lactate dehydrogenase complex protein LldE [Rhodoblastus acidophilus]PPQ37009.1 Fe-S oxidoreductase [Rhodoblastus acidophilus]RAI18590.1 Fe-S oxidoreductase [Rhodoblastus acidophilus]SNB70045.1 L-lactate dehydrogenase complex protein LldE [Rhodoblastus acidophilus]
MEENANSGGARQAPPKVGLFATCLVDMLRPNIGFSALELLRAAGCDVEVPKAQTCCGQPAYNSGDDASAKRLARQVIEIFEDFDYLVAPSGSCAAMIRVHYPELFHADPAMRERAERLGAKTFELLSFLADVRGFRPRGVSCKASATYHDTCSGLRELGVKAQPRALLAAIEGLEMRPMEGEETCCGFGGTFCVKYSEISDAIVTEKAENIVATGADLLLGGDLGCLLNMAGKLRRAGASTRVFHAAELLAGRALHAIGEEKP